MWSNKVLNPAAELGKNYINSKQRCLGYSMEVIQLLIAP